MKNASTDYTYGILSTYRNDAEEQEKIALYSKATFSKDNSRLTFEEEDYRLPYKHDVDRIIHSKAYSRYTDKTQVAYLVENDHIARRGLHVQLVSSFSRGIAEILRLNTNLVEAISLGHDVGHPPFGHEGEGYLSSLSEEYENGPFMHPMQSCRLFSEIEPLNLNLAVYDGFLCHDGGTGNHKLIPNFGKTWEDHFKEKEQKKLNPEMNIMPGTLEGCVVKLCDTISYLARDIEDGINLKIITRDQVPDTILGRSNREILHAAARDIIQQSYNNDFVAMSPEAYQAVKTLRSFNFQNIYIYPKLKVESKKIKRSYRILFEWLLDDLKKQKQSSYIWNDFVHNKSAKYVEQTTPIQMVVDYISGMTDNFFVRTLQKLIVPSQIEIV
jgi:dGTPase